MGGSRTSTRSALCHSAWGGAVQVYLDGEAGPTTARRVRSHLRRCPRCRSEVWQLLCIKRALANNCAPVDPAALARLAVFIAALHQDGQ